MKDIPTQSRQTVLEKFPTKTKYGIVSDRISSGKKANGNPNQQHVFRGIKLKEESEWFKKTDNEDEEKNPKSPRGEGYGLQVGNRGNGDGKLPDLPTIDEYEKERNQEKIENLGSELPDLPTQDPHHPPLEKNEKLLKKLIEDLETKLRKHLEANDGIETLSKVYSLGQEWYPGIAGPEFQDLIDAIKKGRGFNFNYATQNVSLIKEGSQ